MRAISIRQPWAELVLQGKKRIEYRSRPTRIRGRVYVYASLASTAWATGDWRKVRRTPGDLPVGKLVGTVEIVGCRSQKVGRSREYHWLLARPRRLTRPIKPRRHAQPVFFWPF